MTRRPRPPRTGYSFVEVVLALLIVSLLFLPLFTQLSQNRRSSLDSAAELLAHSLAEEPIEIFRAFGYRWASTYGKTHSIPGYPLGVWHEIAGAEPGPIDRPSDSVDFWRIITLQPLSGQCPGLRMRVKVTPRGGSRLDRWLSQDEIVAETVLFEKPR